MDLRELGAMLKAERERRGLSDNDVIDRIKIGRVCLKAIEEGDQSGLPHPVYAKGFIKNYAKLLDLDPEEIGEVFAAAVGFIPETAISPQNELNEPVASGRIRSASGDGGGFLRYVIVAVVILVVVGGGLWLYSLLFSGSGDKTPPPPGPGTTAPGATSQGMPKPEASQSEALSVTPAEPAKTTVPGAPVTPPATAMPTVAPPAALPDVKPITPSADSEEPADPSLAPDIVLGEHGAHSVTVYATGECWIDVSVDGGTTKGIMLAKGKRFVGHFNESLLVRLGNAGGVEVRYDDKVYPLQAAPGEVKTLKFVTKGNGEVPSVPSTSLTTQVPMTPKTGPATSAAPVATVTPVTPATPAAATPATPPAITATPAAPVATVTPVTPAATKPATDAAAPATGGHSLDIIGTEGSWVIITADGGKPKEVFVKKGQTLTEPYKDRIDVRLGNPSSVVFKHEGQEFPMSTQRGEVKSIKFPTP